MKKVLVSASVLLVFTLYVFAYTSGAQNTSANDTITQTAPAVVAANQTTDTPLPPPTTPRTAATEPVYNTVTAPQTSTTHVSVSDQSAQTTAAASTRTPAPVPTPTPAPTPAVVTRKGPYNDGTYTGDAVDHNYGTVQVQATIQDGQLASIQILQSPNHARQSLQINSYALPQLVSEAIQAQSANVDTVSGATLTSGAFKQSLSSALTQAKA